MCAWSPLAACGIPLALILAVHWLSTVWPC